MKEALGAVKKAISLKKDDASLWNNLGDLQNKLERYDDARASFEKAIELRPEYDVAMLNLARTYIASGKTKKGIGILDGCLKKRPDWRDATLLLAEVRLKMSGIDAVKDLLSNFAESGDQDALYLLALGTIQEGRYDEGENYISDILHLNDKHVGATYLRGVIAEAKGSSTAKEIYSKVLQMDPGHAGARRRLNASGE
jgi:tetratricopeptide (TPR) repeat protein